MKSKFFSRIVLCLLLVACANHPTTPIDEENLAPASPEPILLDQDAISPENVAKITLLNRFGGRGAIRSVSYLPDGKTFAVVTEGSVHLYDAGTQAEIDSFQSPHFFKTAFNLQGDFLALEEGFNDSSSCMLTLSRFSGGLWQKVGAVETDDLECLGAALSPDGKYMASVNYANLLTTVWRTRDMTQVQAFPIEYPGDIYSIRVTLAFSGQDTLAVGEDSYVNVYNLQTGTLLHRVEESGITSFNSPDPAISQDGRVLAARSQVTSKVLVWHLDTGKTLTLEDTQNDWSTGNILLSPDGTYIAFSRNGEDSNHTAIGWIDIWQTSDGSLFPSLQRANWIYGPYAAFSQDGSTLITGGEDGVNLWQVRDGTLSLSYSVPGFAGVEGRLSPDRTLLAASSRESIQLYRLSDGKVLQTLEEETQASYPSDPFFSPDGSILASTRIPGKIQLWHVSDGILERVLEYKCADPFSSVIFSPDGQFLAVYGNSETCRGIAVWQVSSGKRIHEFRESGGNSFAILPDEILVVENSAAATISFVKIQDGTILQTINIPAIDEFGNLLWSFAPANQFYAVGPTNGEIKIWQIGKNEPLYAITTNRYEWTALFFSPDGKNLITTSDTIQVRNASDGNLRYSLDGDLPRGAGLFSPDGAMMVTVNESEAKSMLWNISDGTLLRILDTAGPLLFSPDGDILVSREAVREFWRVEDGTLLYSLEGAGFPIIFPVIFSPDGRLLIAMGEGVVEVWGIP